MDGTATLPQPKTEEIWPTLPYDAWKPTLTTLHMWCQVVGKVKLQLVPFLNEWWEICFTITARGMTSGTIPCGARVFQVDLDFIDHRLDVHVSDGGSRTMKLYPRSVADFYREFMAHLRDLGLEVAITTNPVEVANTTPFDHDVEHGSYEADAAHRWWRVCLQADRLLQRYRTPFVGKSSPVLFWWGSFDLSHTRFSGRPAPKQEWPTRWMALGADQEAAAAGFWPGNDKFPAPAFFAYTFPEPPGCAAASIRPDSAIYHPDLAEFILPYEDVRSAPNADDLVLDFFNSTYEAGVGLAGWDRAGLEGPRRDPRGNPR